MKKANECVLYLVRHGQTEWNVKRLIQGHMDIPLNGKGRKQVSALAKKLEDIQFHAVYSSDLSRTSETAELIAKQHHREVITTTALRERYFGKFQGRSFGKNKNILKLINDLKKSTVDENEIENDEKVMKRFVGYLRQISRENIGETILVVTHAGPMRTFLITIGWGSYENLTEGCIDNLAFVKLASDGKNFTVEETSGIAKLT